MDLKVELPLHPAVILSLPRTSTTLDFASCISLLTVETPAAPIPDIRISIPLPNTALIADPSASTGLSSIIPSRSSIPHSIE